MIRSKIEKLSARIEALAAPSEGGIVFIWRDHRQTEIEACKAHYQCRPEDRKASQVYASDGLTVFVDWAEQAEGN